MARQTKGPRYVLRIVDWSGLDGKPDERSWYLIDRQAKRRPGIKTQPCMMWHEGTEKEAEAMAAWAESLGYEVDRIRVVNEAQAEAALPGAA